LKFQISPEEGDKSEIEEHVPCFTLPIEAIDCLRDLGVCYENFDFPITTYRKVFAYALVEGCAVSLNYGDTHSKLFSYDEVITLNELISGEGIVRHKVIYYQEKNRLTKQTNLALANHMVSLSLPQTMSALLDIVEEIFAPRLGLDPHFKESIKGMPHADGPETIQMVWHMILVLANAYSAIVWNNLELQSGEFEINTGFCVINSPVHEGHLHIADLIKRDIQLRFSVLTDQNAFMLHSLEPKEKPPLKPTQNR
jgi:hypothetical protein